MQEIGKATIIFGILSICHLPPAICRAEAPRYVRVAVVQGASSLRLQAKGLYEIIDARNSRVFSRGKDLNTTVSAYPGGMLLGKVKAESHKVIIRSAEAQALIINGRNFRGDIELLKDAKQRLTAVNFLEIEDYVKGVLYHEASHYWPMEALKAQAVVCRTYALYQIQESSAQDFDLTADIYSQVYGGKTSERYRTNQAVKETEGLVLTYKAKVFPAYFHATCGGHTEDAARLWNINIAPLKGVACAFCKDSPHFNWHYVASRQEIRDKLSAAGHKLKDIQDMQILGTDNSGRITDLKIIGADKEVKISAKDFRSIVGPNVIRSTNFGVSLVEDDIVFEGLGWGHGAGLCQWGAYFMAKQGRDYAAILRYYYPAAEIAQR
jgi:stage II sporulation protein D